MELPCDGDGVCMVCKQTPSDVEALTCNVCTALWHVNCLSQNRRPETLASAGEWDCPDCVPGGDSSAPKTVAASGLDSKLRDAVRKIESNNSLSDLEKARRRQKLLAGESDGEEEEKKNEISCSVCMELPDRPVTTPCGHNFCLKCFQSMVNKVGYRRASCPNCRALIPAKTAREPRINEALVKAIRAAKMCSASSSGGPPREVTFVHNQDKPDKAFVTERAKKTGKANACSGKIFVTVPSDHFGPILACNDPTRNRGILVGDCWPDRMDCRQWGAHFPHVAGIAGQSDHGAQSVVLSGGYEDDEDHGEWFLYTGSGGRDLSGNKRTNKLQSFDQKFDKYNAALRLSCLKGYPVRVIRSHKEKRSSYAPQGEGVRYDGIYRIEKCWRKAGKQGFKMCRYLFVRCDNEPASWTTDTQGDRPRRLPKIKELDNATDVTTRKAPPSWDFDEERGIWLWKKPPPESKKGADCDEDGRRVKYKKRLSGKEKLLKEFGCLICKKVMVDPLSTPCGHNFCMACLQGAFAGQSAMRQRTFEGGRSLRATKNVMGCPQCKTDISDLIANPKVNRELMSLIESIQRRIEEENAEIGEGSEEPKAESTDDADDDADDEDEADDANDEDESDDANDETADVDDEDEISEEDEVSEEDELSEEADVPELTDEGNLDVSSEAMVKAKGKMKMAIDVAVAEETVPKPATGKTTRAKSKMAMAGETRVTADEGKRRSKRKVAAAEDELSEEADVPELSDEEILDVNSGAMAKAKVKGKMKMAIDVTVSEETMAKPSTGRTTRAKPKMAKADETFAAADEGKRRSKRKVAAAKDESFEEADAPELTDKENLDVNSRDVAKKAKGTKGKMKMAIDASAVEETVAKPASGRTTRANPKMAKADETCAAADEGKRRSKRKFAAAKDESSEEADVPQLTDKENLDVNSRDVARKAKGKMKIAIGVTVSEETVAKPTTGRTTRAKPKMAKADETCAAADEGKRKVAAAKDESSEEAGVPELTDKETLIVYSRDVARKAKGKIKMAIDASAAEATVAKPATGITTRAKPKMAKADELCAAANEGKRKVAAAAAEDESSEEADVPELTDKENLDVNSRAVAKKAKGKMKMAINDSVAEETVAKPATGRTTRAKSKVAKADETCAAADGGKRKVAAAEVVLSSSSDVSVKTRGKKAKRA